MLAGSRSEVLVINALERLPTQLAEIENWESARTVNLPWVEHLKADEILILRNEASDALPRLRELLRERLTEPTEGHGNRLHQAVADLRSQVLEVESELEGLKLGKERNYRVGMSGLATSFIIYGLATQSPAVVATSLAALLATLAHMRTAERAHDAARTKLVSTPAYALLKARQILARRA